MKLFSLSCTSIACSVTLLSSVSILMSGCNLSQPINTVDTPAETRRLTQDRLANIEVQNPSDFKRDDQSLYVSYYDLGLTEQGAHLSASMQGKSLASQAVDIDQDGTLDGLLLALNLAAGETVMVDIVKTAAIENNFIKRTQAEISHKTGGTWVPHSKHKESQYKEYIGGEFTNVQQLTPPSYYTDHSNWIRYEGPGIESDKVGYRVYLDHRNGFDIFGKLTSEPALQKVGQDGYASYHELQPWGMDILKVGRSLGAGGFGLWHKDKLSLIKDVEQWTATINENGAIRSSMKIDYQGWQSEVGKQDITARIAMQAGSRLAKLTLDLEKPSGKLAAGLVKHKNTEFIQGDLNITSAAYSYIASWGKQSLDGSHLGMAVFFKKEFVKQITQDKKNYLAILAPKGLPTATNPQAQQVDYYFAAVWEPESGIDTKQKFIEYLNQEAEKLTIQPRVRINTQLTNASLLGEVTAQSALNWSVKMADSELKRKGNTYRYDGWDVNRRRLPKFEYDILGLYPFMFNELGNKTNNPDFKQVLVDVAGSFITDDGNIKRYKKTNFNIDSIAPGRSVLALYKETGEQKYQQAAQLLRQQLVEHPRTSEGAFWHKKKYTHQLWLDGVYMGVPFLAEYAMMFESGDTRQHSLEEVVNEFVLTRKYLKDAKTGYYYHAWDEAKKQDWADKNTGLSPNYWARGMGWFVMALVDVLDIIPVSETELRAPLIEIVQETAASLLKAQDSQTATWWQVMDKPNAVGNYRESSASSMFVYFLAKAVDEGYIDASYKAHAVKAYQGLLNEFILVHADGTISMTNQCYVAGLGFGRDGSYLYYMQEPVSNNDPKGTIPFMLAGVAIHDMLN
ncbi:DUF4861 family protein [Algibacillus agarilyticus]|uniref:DUF4861 family protein n=1 Tax=Algibacillus agarilyticus TaxID=2234133 RepID=UPI000DD03FEF|nr:glycoside hydrolase family 88 protein [Algibacillus agarilyticus]